MHIRLNLCGAICAPIASISFTGCDITEEPIGDHGSVSEIAAAVTCLSLDYPWQGCLSVTSTPDRRFIISGVNLGDGVKYFGPIQVCYKKRGSWQTLCGSGYSSVQGSTVVIHDPADGDFDWSTPVLLADEYRIQVRGVIYGTEKIVYDDYHWPQLDLPPQCMPGAVCTEDFDCEPGGICLPSLIPFGTCVCY